MLTHKKAGRMTAAKLFEGSWTARWGNWAVGLQSRGDSWDVKVWRWPPGSSLLERVELDAWDDFKTANEAVTWACRVMKQDGARMMVIDAPRHMTLERLLMFSPAPEVAQA